MRHGIRTCLGCDLNQSLGNKRPRNGRSKKVKAFVKSVGAEHWENKIARELFPKIFDINLFDAEHLSFLARRVQFFALAQVSRERNDLAPVLVLEPFQNDRGIETAGIGENDFLWRRHGRLSQTQRFSGV